MIKKEIHWWDLDGTLWQLDTKIWIIDKNDPKEALLKVTPNEANLLVGGYHKNEGLRIWYNGLEAWLSQEIYDKVLKEKNGISIEDLGISYREFTDINKIGSQTEMIVHANRVKKRGDTRINVLTARMNMEAHTDLLAKLNETLSNSGITIDETIFVNDPKSVNYVGSSAEKKTLKILESIIGFKVTNKEFLPITVDKYELSYFYDDEDKNIHEASKINVTLRKLYDSSHAIVKKRIKDYLDISTPKLIINYVTTNELNPFITTEVDIKLI